MNRADLHVHTTASDGIFTPYEVVDWAAKKEIKAIAITDHDTTEGIKTAIERSNLYDIIVIPGIEMSCIYKNEEVHILGYFIDYENEEIIQKTTLLKESRVFRGEKMVKKLNHLGFNLSMNDVYDIAGYGAIGRPHIARAMIKKDYINSTEEAFDKYLRKGKPAYVERLKLSIRESIDLIHNTGGVAVVAHPGLLHTDKGLHEAIRLGIDGIESIHSKHSQQDVQRYIEIADKYNLIITGGSDFHGDIENNLPVLGNFFVDYEQVSLLFAKSNKYK